MATAADGGAYEGGVGGKLRRKPLRRAVAATPYDRPPNAIRNSISISGSEADTNNNNNNNNGWLLKIVDPASRIITRGAQRLFSSVFRKRLPAPALAPTIVSVETNHAPQTRDEFRIAASFNPSGAQEKVSNEVNRSTDNSDADSLNELEKILKQKTFTREEIDRLTDLLRSRTVDMEGHQKQKSEPNTLQPVILKENGAKMQNFVEEIAAPVVSSCILDEDVASPAELAKAYMGKRSSRIAPSPLGLHSQPLRDDVISLSNAPFSAKSPCMALAPRSAVRFANVPGVSETSYVTPIRRGRSAIYNMARTPYSRMSNHTASKGVESAVNANVGPSSPQWSWENNDHSGAIQVSKRRSSVLDSDIGSVGPIRRIRRKTNMVSPSKSASLVTSRTPLSSPATAMCTDVAQASTSSNQNLLLLDEPKHNTSSHKLVDNLGKNTPDVGFASVPSQSNEMARRILQQLDKLVPSPKEKSSELKLATGTGKAPTKLSPGMLHGLALRSMEAVDSSKLLHNIQGVDSVNGLGGARLSGSQDSSRQARVRVEENGPSKVSSTGVKWASETNGIAVKSVEETSHSVDADSVISNLASNLPQKKRGFQISAHEDSLEFDDIPDKEKPDSSVTEQTNADGTEIVDKHGISSSGSLPVAISTSKTIKNVGASEVLLPAARKDTGFTFSNTHAPSAISEPAVPSSEPPPLFNGPAPTKESTTAPVFSFGSKDFNSPASFTFSSTSATSESLSFKFGGHGDSKLETSISAATPAARMTETTSIAAEVDKGNNDKSQEAGNLPKQEDAVPSSSLPSATALFSVGGSMSNSTPKKESFSSSASLISATSTSTITSGSASNSIFSVPAISAIPSGASNTIFSSAGAGASTAETTSSIVASMPTSSTFSPAPTFHFGSSTSAAAPSVSAPLPSATSEVDSAGPGLNAKEVSSFGSLSSSSFGATSSAFAGTSSGIFAFGASAPSTTSTTSSTSFASNPFQSSNTANVTASGSASFSQAAPGTGNSVFTQSMPMQFGSAASTPAFGSSGSSPFSSGSALFSSSTGGNLFSIASSFNTGSSLNSTGVSSFSFTAGSGSSVSGSSSQSTASSIFGSSMPTTGFSFGLSSATAGTGSALPFGSSLSGPSGSIFSFSSAASTSSAPLSPTFSSFGSTAPAATIGTASPGNDQMNMEDSMAEDTIQAAPSPPVGPVFGQPANSLAPSFQFGSPASSGGPSLFQFGSQPSPLTTQNPFGSATSNNLDFAAGGSFSLGTGGGDKSNRKIIKVNRTKLRKR